MSSAIENAADLLFGDVNRPALNVRFLHAGVPNVTAEHLAEQIVLSETQIRSGRARLIENMDDHIATLRAAL